jgi:polysaccharide export outer membrane protein
MVAVGHGVERRGSARLTTGMLVLAAALLAPSFGTAQPSAPPDYLIGPADLVVVTVWTQAELSGRFRVDPDGSFGFPLIGRVQAAGLTVRGLETHIRGALANGFLKDPQVTVTVEEYGSQRVFVVGEVRQPGTYLLTGRMTLIEVLARAGSTTPEARGEVLIVRPREALGAADQPLAPDASEAEVSRIDLRQLENGTLAGTVLVKSGDTLVVPRADLVYVLGEVRSPGAYPFGKGTTVLQALSLAGGVTERGATNRARVVRTIQGERKELKIALSELVLAGDTIIVPEKFF